jgi:peptide/nickel transport system substrate-binding protein
MGKIRIKMKSHKLLLACMLLIILTSIHCSRDDRTLSDATKVIIGYYGDETIFLQEHWGMEATFLIFLPLVESMYGYLDPQPALAERWEHSEDYKEWTFYLRKNVKWHDGVAVTSQDIKFTFDLRKKLNRGTGSVVILEEYTFKFISPRPINALDSYDVFYPKHLLEGLDPEEFFNWEFWSHPVGNGPYRYVRHVPKTMVEVEANPDHYRGKPKIEKVVLKFTENYLTELLSGNIDAVGGLNSLDLLAIKKDPRFRTYHGWGNTTGTIYWNHDYFLFQNPEIRRALTLAINRSELAEVLNYPDGVPLKDTIMTIRQYLKGAYPDPLPYDTDQARRILEKHGWHDIDGDGIRESDGKEFRFMAHISSSLPGAEECAIYVQDQFRRVGIRMEIQALERNLLVKRIRNSDFQALFFLIDGSLHQPNFGDARLFGKKSPLGYNNPEMIRLLEAALLEIDPDKLDKIYEMIMPIFMEDMPMTLLLPWTYSSVAHKRIKGLSDIRVDPIWNMEYLWIEEEK